LELVWNLVFGIWCLKFVLGILTNMDNQKALTIACKYLTLKGFDNGVYDLTAPKVKKSRLKGCLSVSVPPKAEVRHRIPFGFSLDIDIQSGAVKYTGGEFQFGFLCNNGFKKAYNLAESFLKNLFSGIPERDLLSWKQDIQKSKQANQKKTDKITVVVGSRPVGKPPGSLISRHRYLRWKDNVTGKTTGWEMGYEPSGYITAGNGGFEVWMITEQYRRDFPGLLKEASIQVSHSGLMAAIRNYESIWLNEHHYVYNNYNSNYAINSVICAAGGNVPKELGMTPEFARHKYHI
jgi:hypothetical protein